MAADHTLTAPPRAVPSEDGTTLMYPVSTTEPGQDDDARTAFVDEVRETAKGGDGLSVRVGGPGAMNTDAQKVYGSLGGPLLYTTVAVVAILLVLIYRSPLLWLVPLAVAGVADALSMAVVHGLNRGFDITVTGQSSAVMTILVFGSRHRLRAAAGLPLPGGAHPPRPAARSDGGSPARLRPRRRGLLRHRRGGPPVPSGGRSHQ